MNFSDLIPKIKEGDTKAFKVLYNHYAPLFKGIAYRYVHDLDLANDLIQETFIKIFKNINSYTGNGNFEGWMKRILVNNCLNHIKANTKFVVDSDRVMQEEKSRNWQEVIADLSFKEIVSIIEQLPSGYRTVFNLSVMEGYSHKEIGKLLNITESASRSQLTKAKAKLKEELKQLNIFSSIA